MPQVYTKRRFYEQNEQARHAASNYMIVGSSPTGGTEISRVADAAQAYLVLLAARTEPGNVPPTLNLSQPVIRTKISARSSPRADTIGAESQTKATTRGRTMNAVVAPSHRVVRHLSRDEVEARLRQVEAEMERSFGTVENALRQEYTGDYPSEQIRLFTEYHGMKFLLGT